VCLFGHTWGTFRKNFVGLPCLLPGMCLPLLRLRITLRPPGSARSHVSLLSRMLSASHAVALVRAVLTPDLLRPEWRAGWSPENPAFGHCAGASEAVYFLLGGPKAGIKAWVARDSDGRTHWWLQDARGVRIDPTADQYTSVGRTPPYERGLPGRPCGFQGQRRDPANRYGFGRKPSGPAARILQLIESAP